MVNNYICKSRYFGKNTIWDKILENTWKYAENRYRKSRNFSKTPKNIMKKSKIKNRLRQFDKKICGNPKNVNKILIPSPMLSSTQKNVGHSFSEFGSFWCKIIAKPMISSCERLGTRGGEEAPQDHRTVPRIDSELVFVQSNCFWRFWSLLDRVVRTLALRWFVYQY